MKKSAKHKEASVPKHEAKEMHHAEPDHHTSTQQPSKKKLIITIAVIAVLAVGLLWLVLGKGASTVGKPILAKVNGEPIYKNEVETLVLQAQQQGIPLSENQVLEQMIAKKLLLQEAKKEKVNIDEAAVDKYIEDLKALLAQPIEPLLGRMGITEEEFRRQIREQLIVTALLADKQQAERTITDDEIKVFYEANEEYFVATEKVRASHILVKTEEEAKEIVKQLEGGADFAKLAKENSIDPSAKTNGGDLGFFGQGQMVPEFEKTAFALDVDERSAPVKSQFGYHIILLREKRKA